MSTRPHFRVGDLVEESKTGRHGTIVHVFTDETLRGVVAVLLEGTSDAIAMHVGDIRLRREGGAS
jgi:hypothetical protein